MNEADVVVSSETVFELDFPSAKRLATISPYSHSIARAWNFHWTTEQLTAPQKRGYSPSGLLLVASLMKALDLRARLIG